MIEIIDQAICNGCSACVGVCPVNCIAMTPDPDGFLFPRVDTTACIDCGRCKRVCPVASKPSATTTRPVSYAVMNKNESIREQSSSGGYFTLLASFVLAQGGVVFGAAFNQDFEVEHICVETESELAMLRGSKYTQSRIGDSFQRAKAFLETGRQVLFSGTPCQIGGLYAFLGKPYDNLITQDIICHGVPSPAVWKKYLGYRKQCAGSDLENVSFRSKKHGWKRYRVAFRFSNGTGYESTVDKDPMMQVFLKDLCLRESCYDCAFKSVSRTADITLADFWGIERVAPQMDDDKGTSLVVVHTEKGARIFESLREKAEVLAVDLDLAVSGNPAMIRSAKRAKKREQCMKELTAENFETVVKKYCKRSLWQKIKGKIKGLLRRLKKGFKKI